MASWSDEELARIGDIDEIRIVTRRPDGTTRKPVIIWVVRVGNDLYVRSVLGRKGDWYQGAQERPDGRILVDGVGHEVIFEPADPALRDAIDDAYHAKYDAESPEHVPPIVTTAAAETTLRLVPRGHN